MKKILLSLTLLFNSVLIYSQNDTINVDTSKVVEFSSVEISGVRTSNPITETTLYSRNFLKSYQGQEVSNILSQTTSVTSYYDNGNTQGYGYFRIRGIDQTRINMTLNGVPLNEPEDQGGYFSNYPGFIHNISSLQIQRGIGTSSNGTSSYGGSINFEGKNGLNKGGSFEVGYGSFNSKRFNANYSTGLDSNKLALFMSVSSYGSDGYKNNSASEGNSLFLSGGYFGDKNILKFTAFNGQSFNQMAWLAVDENDLKKDHRTSYHTPDEDDRFNQSHAQLQYIRNFNKKSLLSTTFYYTKLRGDYNSFIDTSNLGNFKLSSNFYGVLSNYKYENKKFMFITGVHGYMYNRKHSMNIKPSNIDEYVNIGYKDEISTFLKFRRTFNKFNIFLDISQKYTTFKYKGDVSMNPMKWFFVNPRGGVSYKINNNNFYSTIGQSYREPTRTDLFRGDDNLSIVRYILPEEVIDYEIGYKFNNKKILLNTNLYYMDFKNEIVHIGEIGSNDLPLMDNVDNSFRLGLEFDINYEIIKNLKIYNNTNISRNRIINNGLKYEPLYTPPVIINNGIRYENKYFFLDISSKYHSKSHIALNEDFTTDSFFILNLDAGLTLNRFILSGKLINLTNKKYYTNGYVYEGVRNFYVNAPLSGYLTLKMIL